MRGGWGEAATDQESRSTNRRAANSVAGMDTSSVTAESTTDSTTSGVLMVLHPVTDLTAAEALYFCSRQSGPSRDGRWLA